MPDMTPRIFRYEIPIDDVWHPLSLPSDSKVMHVAARDRTLRLNRIEFWALSGGTEVLREFRVYETGNAIPDGVAHVGSAITPGETFVWHLFEKLTPGAQE